MLSSTLAALLKLPAKDRIELALALWESLADAERDRCFLCRIVCLIGCVNSKTRKIASADEAQIADGRRRLFA